MARRGRWLAGMAALLALAAGARAGEFRAPERITADEPGIKPHLSRNTGGQMVWTAQGTLALAYWTGEMDTLEPGKASRVQLREWSPRTERWSAPVVVSQAINQAGIELGARQPALLARPDGSLFVAWHDHRHSTTSLNLINNVEIYADMRPPGGGFGQDMRLSETSSGSNGDNGWLPQLVNLPGGRMALAWYDFTWNADVSEVVLKLSDAAGDFGGGSLAGIIRTDASFRSAGDAGQSFTAPAVAVDGNGMLHLVWATGNTSGPDSANLYYGRIDPTLGAWLEKGRLKTLAGGQTDPARLVADPNPSRGDVWLIYTDYGVYDNQEILLQRRRKGAAAFDPPVRLTSDAGTQTNPTAAVGPDGRVHCVYVDKSAAAVRYVVYDPAAGSVSAPVNLNGTLAGDWAVRPAIATDAGGNVFVVWEDPGNPYQPGSTAALYFTTDLRKNGAVGWRAYE